MSLWSDLQKPLIATGESQDTFVAGSQVWFTRGPRKYHATVKGKNLDLQLVLGANQRAEATKGMRTQFVVAVLPW